MSTKIEKFINSQLKKDLPDVRPGDTIEVYQIIKETGKKDKSSTKKESKERIQIFKGLIIAKKHGKGISATITVKRIFGKIEVEKIFPLHSPLISKIEIISRGKVRRAKLYYLKNLKGKKARLKKKDFSVVSNSTESVPAKIKKLTQKKEIEKAVKRK